MDNIVFLTIIYCCAYGGGLLISKLWGWLQVIAIVIIARALLDYNYLEMTFSFFLVVVVPLCILAYPSIQKKFGRNLGLTANPLRWAFDKISEIRYRIQRERRVEEEQKARMQAEEAEKQRQHEREQAQQERAERDARERTEREEARARAEREARERAKSSQQESRQKKADTNQDPYEVLGVSRTDSLEDIKKAHRILASKYHPDKVSHLAPEFQEWANEKLKEINVAWDKIMGERG